MRVNAYGKFEVAAELPRAVNVLHVPYRFHMSIEVDFEFEHWKCANGHRTVFVGKSEGSKSFQQLLQWHVVRTLIANQLILAVCRG